MGDSESEGEVVHASELRDSERMGSSSASLSSPKKRVKSQVEEDEDDEESVCCGICYAERGVSIAGEIDCCSHYFCFVWIMEWAKHESQCPICSQRFSKVCRLPMHGVFYSSRDIHNIIKIRVKILSGSSCGGVAAEVKRVESS